VPAVDGTTDFSVLQNELKRRSTKIVMVAFDLLYLLPISTVVCDVVGFASVTVHFLVLTSCTT
jgi:hypothetical protein